MFHISLLPRLIAKAASVQRNVLYQPTRVSVLLIHFFKTTTLSCVTLKIQQKLVGVSYLFGNGFEEGNTFSSINQAMIVRQGQIHHGTGHDFTLFIYHWAELGCRQKMAKLVKNSSVKLKHLDFTSQSNIWQRTGVHPEDGRLRGVDNGSSH